MEYVLGYCVWVGLGVIVYRVGVRIMGVCCIFMCVFVLCVLWGSFVVVCLCVLGCCFDGLYGV